MKVTNDLGIWMDHANAYFTEFTTEPMTTHKLESAFTHQQKAESMIKSETISNHREQHEGLAYYKKLGAIILNYTDVILFGPTNAKTELFNLLRADHRFEQIHINVQNTDKMEERQQQIFVREHFSKKY